MFENASTVTVARYKVIDAADVAEAQPDFGGAAIQRLEDFYVTTGDIQASDSQKLL